MYSYRYIGQIKALWIDLRNLRSLSKHCLRNFSNILLELKIIRFIGMQKSNPSKKLLSGNEIPMIGFGTYQMRGKECRDAVKVALKCGYTHIDTASIYKNQEQIGKVLSELKVDRSKIYITSKIAPDEQGYQNAKQACQKMLKRLGTQYLDLLIIHWPGVKKVELTSSQNSQIRRETWRALIDLKKEGKVRDIGVSNYLKSHLQDLMQHSDVKPSINQFQIHPLLWEKETIDFCRENNIVIQAYSPLARGNEELFNNNKVKAISQKHKKTIAQVCLRWALQHDFIILPKSKSENRIIQNFSVFDFKLDEEDMNSLNELTKKGIKTCWDPKSIS